MRTQDAKVDPLKVKQLSFMEGVYPYCWEDSSGPTRVDRRGVLIGINHEKYPKLVDTLSGGEVQIEKGDKIYKMLPCALDDRMVKRIATSLGATVTDDYTKATVYLGNSRSMVFNFQEVPTKDDFIFQHQYLNLGTVLEDVIDEPSYSSLEDPSTLRTVFADGVQHLPVHGVLAPVFWCTPLMFDIIYNMLTRKVRVVSVDYFLDSAKREKLTVDQLEKIGDMLKKGKDFAKVAREMLWQADYDDPGTMVELYLWSRNGETYDLALEGKGRTKRENVFLQKTGFAKMPNMSETEFLVKMKDSLTKEVVERFSGFKFAISNLHIKLDNSGLKNFYDLQLVPKKGYEHLFEQHEYKGS